MRKRKTIRGAFYTNTGTTAAFLAGDISVTSIDNDWWITYLEGTDYWKIAPTGTTNATTGPIIVDSLTTSIVVTPANLSGATGSTQQLAVVNQDTINVITECEFATDTAGVATVGATSGLISIVGTGDAIITTTHNDGPTGVTAVYGYMPTTSLVVTPAAYTGSTTGGTQLLTVVNENSIDVIGDCTFASDDTNIATVDSVGEVTFVGNIGTVVITVTHISTVTGTPTTAWAFSP